MLIYGSKFYGTKNVVKGIGSCPFCGAYGKHKSYEGRKWGHLYFIPLIPSGKPVRVMKECANCQTGNHLALDQVAKLYQDIEEQMQACILAAGDSRRTFDDGQGNEVNTGPFLLDAIDLMFTAGYDREIAPLIALLDSDASRYEYKIASGAYNEIRGRADESLADYQAANAAAPDQPLPYSLLADAYGRAGRFEENLDMLDKAIQREPDNPHLLLVRVMPLEQLGRYSEIIEVMDRAEAMLPDLAQDKQYKKQRKKYEKKAAKAGW